MKGKRLHALKRPKLRQSWNKYNLYNLWRQRDPQIGLKDNETYFQQKWRAKGLLRSYHGEHIKEQKWERMFSRRLFSVVDIEPRKMASTDGSELAAGRGSGREEKAPERSEKVLPPPITPYMNMTFAPMERRLDIAVFRALFASSARQARQFCIHGAVKVNGKVMPHPSYRLNPGDMFQVEPDLVMAATGRPKPRGSAKKKEGSDEGGDQDESSSPTKPPPKPKPSKDSKSAEEVKSTEATKTTKAEKPREVSKSGEKSMIGQPEPATAPAEEPPDTTDKADPIPLNMKPTRNAIKALIDQAQGILKSKSAFGLKPKDKQDLRAFLKGARGLMSRVAQLTPSQAADELHGMLNSSRLETDISRRDTEASSQEGQERQEGQEGQERQERQKGQEGQGAQEEPGGQQGQGGQQVQARTSRRPRSIEDLTEAERKYFEKMQRKADREADDNPLDPTKPYNTPWMPKPYMSPFAFIPKYLEVNQNICSAVYLRHPVAKVGKAEVPTPFGFGVNQLAFNWYLRRR